MGVELKVVVIGPRQLVAHCFVLTDEHFGGIQPHTFVDFATARLSFLDQQLEIQLWYNNTRIDPSMQQRFVQGASALLLLEDHSLEDHMHLVTAISSTGQVPVLVLDEPRYDSGVAKAHLPTVIDSSFTRDQLDQVLTRLVELIINSDQSAQQWLQDYGLCFVCYNEQAVLTFRQGLFLCRSCKVEDFSLPKLQAFLRLRK